MKNPYTISFGKEPTQLVSRIAQINKIVDDFSEEEPSYQACIISGVRGIGKTVTLSEICNRLNEDKNWIVINLNSGMDLLHSLAAKLYNCKPLLGLFDNANINLSFFNIGIALKTAPPITDIETALERMSSVCGSMCLRYCTLLGKRVQPNGQFAVVAVTLFRICSMLL